MHPAAYSWQRAALQHQAKDKPGHYVLFRIDRQCYALPLDRVARALRMVALTPVPDMPAWALGMINMAGQTLPVIDLRYLFNQKSKEPELQDRLLVLQAKEQTIAIAVDEVLSVEEFTPEQIEPPSPALSHSRALAATIRHNNALVIILDIYRLIPEEQENKVEEVTL
jgi:purine-binding chemotaxis protein CheW